MSEQPSILAFAGSTRSGSFNKMLVRIAADAAKEAGARVTLVDLRDLALPLYDEDLESRSGLPENAKKLKSMMKASDGFLIAAPEYNSSITGVMKNAIDWASRPEKGEKPLEAFSGKVAGIMSASPGGLGGLRGLYHVRQILSNINMLVIPEQLAISKAGDVFNESGELTDDKQRETVRSIAKRVVEVAGKLKRER
ncbi:MAG: NADPH-dependent oxidoreductase [Phycisphaeraceae bacterium]|nr:MAG: NADPH-dependent oxidoreductase [Phycisphaeraceae bacterium]